MRSQQPAHARTARVAFRLSASAPRRGQAARLPFWRRVARSGGQGLSALSLKRGKALIHRFIVFSSCEPVPVSLENAQ